MEELERRSGSTVGREEKKEEEGKAEEGGKFREMGVMGEQGTQLL